MAYTQFCCLRSKNKELFKMIKAVIYISRKIAKLALASIYGVRKAFVKTFFGLKRTIY